MSGADSGAAAGSAASRASSAASRASSAASRAGSAASAGRAEGDLTGTADERQASFRSVICGRCLAEVQVAKFSPQHTSVQWNPDAMGACEEFTARSAEGEQSARIASCGSLRECIDRAVLEGRVEVAPP